MRNAWCATVMYCACDGGTSTPCAWHMQRDGLHCVRHCVLGSTVTVIYRIHSMLSNTRSVVTLEWRSSRMHYRNTTSLFGVSMTAGVACCMLYPHGDLCVRWKDCTGFHLQVSLLIPFISCSVAGVHSNWETCGFPWQCHWNQGKCTRRALWLCAWNVSCCLNVRTCTCAWGDLLWCGLHCVCTLQCGVCVCVCMCVVCVVCVCVHVHVCACMVHIIYHLMVHYRFWTQSGFWRMLW